MVCLSSKLFLHGMRRWANWVRQRRMMWWHETEVQGKTWVCYICIGYTVQGEICPILHCSPSPHLIELKCVCVSPGFYDRWLISYIFDLLSNFIPNYNIKKKIAYRNITYLLWSILLYLQDKHKCSQPSQLAKQFILIYFFLYFVIFIIVCNAFG